MTRCAGLAGAIVLVALVSPCQAQMSIDAAKITCDQYVHSKIATPNYIAAWLSGYYHAKRGDLTVDVQALQENVNKLEHYCYEEKNFKVPLMKAVEDLLGRAR